MSAMHPKATDTSLRTSCRDGPTAEVATARRQQRAKSSRSVRERVHVSHLRVAGWLRKAKDTPSWSVVVWGCKMTDSGKSLRQSSLFMKIAGWGIIALPLVILVYPPGFLWGMNPPVFPFICWQHSSSPYDGLHPYVFMIVAIYYAWAILMIRGAKDPRANAALFDLGILANLLHAGVMIPQALLYPDEIAHLWADVPALLVLSAACWYWHPNRVAPERVRTAAAR